MQLKIYQADAFTGQLFGGNPAAVIPLDHWLPDETLQNIAIENNLSETAFFVKNKQGKGYQLRWFTPACEVDLCGHATIATAHVLWEHLDYEGDEIIFDSHRGKLGVKRDGDWYTLDFPTDKITKIETPEVIAKALGVRILECWKGLEDYLVLVENESVVANLQPDFKALAQLKSRGVIVTAGGSGVDFISRCFFPAFGIDEDPVTGSAHTTLVPFWSKKLEKTVMTARQISQRGGFLKCHLLGKRTAISGQAVTYLEGVIVIR